MQEVFKEENQMQEHLLLKIYWEQIGQWDQLAQVPKGPMFTMYSHTDYIRWQFRNVEVIPYILGVNLKEVNPLLLFASGDWVK